jgi:hypothetical protein
MITASNIEQKVQVATKVYYLLWYGIERQKFTPALGCDIVPLRGISPSALSPSKGSKYLECQVGMGRAATSFSNLTPP